jgi:hypothetical protein
MGPTCRGVADASSYARGRGGEHADGPWARAGIISRNSFYRGWRADGWPYCPSCGEDELYSLSVPATVETIVGCYLCRWRPPRDSDYGTGTVQAPSICEG